MKKLRSIVSDKKLRVVAPLLLLLVFYSCLITSCTSDKKDPSSRPDNIAQELASKSSAEEDDKKPDILLLVVDTFAARHLAVYNSEIDTAPFLKTLSKRGVVVERAYSGAPWTKPSLATLFTSQYSKKHRVYRLDSKLSENNYTVAEFFRDQGYQTRGIVSHTLLKAGNGYEQGFDDFEIVPLSKNVHKVVTSHLVTDLAIKAVDKAEESQKPLFLFVHYFDPHFDYQDHKEFDRASWYQGNLKPGMGFRDLRSLIPTMTSDDQRYLVDLYREEIDYTDKHIGRFFDHLKKSRFWSNLYTVITADHGEEFLEHGALGHTRTMYDELVRVPLLFVGPEGDNSLWPKGVRFDGAEVTTGDVFPTLSTLAGLTPPEGIIGKSIFSPNGTITASVRPLFAEVDFKSSAIQEQKTAVFLDGKKLIHDFRKNEFLLRDVKNDPAEGQNYVGGAEYVDIESRLRSELEVYEEDLVPFGKEGEDAKKKNSSEKADDDVVPQSDEELEQLRSLGYL